MIDDLDIRLHIKPGDTIKWRTWSGYLTNGTAVEVLDDEHVRVKYELGHRHRTIPIHRDKITAVIRNQRNEIGNS